jgi:hypothetical protein
VVLTEPSSGSIYTHPAVVTMLATAADSDGTISRVEFFGDGTPLGSVMTAPYRYEWVAPSPGSHTLTARAYDNKGASGVSAPVTIKVNLLPSVTLTAPFNGTTVAEPVVIKATATDSDGTIGRVEFYCDGSLLGSDLTAPYQFDWRSISLGSHTLTARAYDNLGAVSESAPVTLTVRRNVALQASGGVASASSVYNTTTPADAVNDGNRLGSAPGWRDATVDQYPDWVQILFSGTKTLTEIDVITVQDLYLAVEPTLTQTFTRYGAVDYDVQYWDGAAWATVPGGSVRGNNLVWRQFVFPAISTDRIRVQVMLGATRYSRIVEIEAYEQ